MEALEQLRMSKRLSEISQEVGFTLWQIQELENVLAHYFVLVTKATRGMGLEGGNTLIADAQSKTFGKIISQLIKAGHLNQELEPRFKALLSERNWLVHKSRISSRSAVHSDAAMNNLIKRLHNIAEESLILIKNLSVLVEQHVKTHGVTDKQIQANAQKILEKWHTFD